MICKECGSKLTTKRTIPQGLSVIRERRCSECNVSYETIELNRDDYLNEIEDYKSRLKEERRKTLQAKADYHEVLRAVSLIGRHVKRMESTEG